MVVCHYQENSMSRMTHLTQHLVLISALLITTHSVNAEVDYNSVDISGLQSQYQQQLKPKPVKKVVTKKAIKRKQIRNNELQQYQQLLANQQQQRARALAQQRARANAQKRAAKQVPRTRPRIVVRPKNARQPVTQAAVQQPRISPQQRPAAPAPRRDAIFEAASSGNVRLIGQLLSQGVNVNQANPERETALHMAAAKGHYSAVIYLLNHGANIHVRTVNNWQPIHHATRFRHAQIANYLKQKGSQIYAKTSDGMSAVDMARTMNDRRILGVFGVR